MSFVCCHARQLMKCQRKHNAERPVSATSGSRHMHGDCVFPIPGDSVFISEGIKTGDRPSDDCVSAGNLICSIAAFKRDASIDDDKRSRIINYSPGLDTCRFYNTARGRLPVDTEKLGTPARHQNRRFLQASCLVQITFSSRF